MEDERRILASRRHSDRQIVDSTERRMFTAIINHPRVSTFREEVSRSRLKMDSIIIIDFASLISGEFVARFYV